MDNLKRIVTALPKMGKAYFRSAIGDKPANEIQEFRKKKCESCVLFNGTTCDRSRVARVNEKGEDEYYVFKAIEKNDDVEYKKDKHGVIRGLIVKDQLFVRGCGCPLIGNKAKWKFSFDQADLEKTDGTAPCVLNKWNYDESSERETRKG